MDVVPILIIPLLIILLYFLFTTDVHSTAQKQYRVEIPQSVDYEWVLVRQPTGELTWLAYKSKEYNV